MSSFSNVLVDLVLLIDAVLLVLIIVDAKMCFLSPTLCFFNSWRLQVSELQAQTLKIRWVILDEKQLVALVIHPMSDVTPPRRH